MDVIRKTPHDYGVGPNLTDYENARARFHWSNVPTLCEGMGPGRCNIPYAAVDRHAAGLLAKRTALRFVTDKGWDGAVATTTADDPALVHFTSGTTGTPKGAIHVHGAVAMHYITGLYALDLHPDDIYWCTADPGRVTGTSYGIISQAFHGVTSIVDEAEFDAERWYRILQDQAVSVWYTAPTAIRMLIKAGPELPAQYHFPRLRFIAMWRAAQP